MQIKIDELDELCIVWNNISKTEIIMTACELDDRNTIQIYMSREQAEKLVKELKEFLK